MTTKSFHGLAVGFLSLWGLHIDVNLLERAIVEFLILAAIISLQLLDGINLVLAQSVELPRGE